MVILQNYKSGFNFNQHYLKMLIMYAKFMRVDTYIQTGLSRPCVSMKLTYDADVIGLFIFFYAVSRS